MCVCVGVFLSFCIREIRDLVVCRDAKLRGLSRCSFMYFIDRKCVHVDQYSGCGRAR